MTYVEGHLARCREQRDRNRSIVSAAIRAMRRMTDAQLADYQALRRAKIPVRDALAEVAGRRP